MQLKNNDDSKSLHDIDRILNNKKSVYMLPPAHHKTLTLAVCAILCRLLYSRNNYQFAVVHDIKLNSFYVNYMQNYYKINFYNNDYN